MNTQSPVVKFEISVLGSKPIVEVYVAQVYNFYFKENWNNSDVGNKS